MFTRKHYERIAQAIAETSGKYEATEAGSAVDSTRDYIANELADMFAEDNPRFDRERFCAAARVENMEKNHA